MTYVTDWTKYAPFFKKEEFMCGCKNCKDVYVSEEFMDRLFKARNASRVKFVIASGGRCPEHNTKVNGAANSDHLMSPENVCMGVDIRVNNSTERYIIDDVCHKAGLTRYGHGNGFIHVGLAGRNPGDMIWLYKD